MRVNADHLAWTSVVEPVFFSRLPESDQYACSLAFA